MAIILIILFVGLFLLLLVPAIVLSLVQTVLSWFGVVPKRKRTFYHRTTWNAGGFEERSSESVRREKKTESKKLFDKNEGEYVDYEEIK